MNEITNIRMHSPYSSFAGPLAPSPVKAVSTSMMTVETASHMAARARLLARRRVFGTAGSVGAVNAIGAAAAGMQEVSAISPAWVRDASALPTRTVNSLCVSRP
jgi:hypothetical protein